MATYVTPKINTEYIFYISLVSQANTKVFQANPTLAAGDFKVATDDGAPANPATLPAVDADFTRRVKVVLSASEMNGGNVTFIASDAAGSEWCDLTINIQTSARQVDDLATPTNITAGTITTATNVTTVNGLAAGVITAASVATGAIDADALAADAVTEIWAGSTAPSATTIANAVWDMDATGHQTQGTFGQAIGDPVADTNTIYKAVVTDAAGATVGVDVVAVKAETASIQTDTNDLQTQIGTAGAGLTAINLPDQTMNITGDITGNLSGSVGSVTGAVGSVTAGVTVTTNNDKTGYGLSAAAVQSVWDALTSALTTVGSIGKKIADWTIGTAQTGDSFARLGAPAGASVSADVAAVKADTAAIKAKTDSLTYTVAGQVDSNVQYVNDTLINGAGTAGNPWGP